MIDTQQITAIRAFNRFYTRQLGVLEETLHKSPYTLTEVRVLYELAGRPGVSAAEIASYLALDAGYLSRIVNRFVEHGLVERRRSGTDARTSGLHLTPVGEDAFRPLDEAAAAAVAASLDHVAPADRIRLINSMAVIEQIFGKAAENQGGINLRSLRPGDVGWSIERHGQIYADEFGWNQEFEALVAKILGEFLASHNPSLEHGWIAELGEKRAGCVFLVKHPTERGTAQLRCLLVEPFARGHGVGSKLVEQCLRFARDAGYRRMVLWTNDVLSDARRIYEAAGFELVEEKQHHSFGHDLVGQTWAFSL